MVLNWEEDDNVKSLQQQRRQTTDKFWSEKLTWAFSSGKLKKLFDMFWNVFIGPVIMPVDS